MDVVYQVVVYTHVLGLAALVGGYFAVLAAARGNGRRSGSLVPSVVMVWGARAQILTGLTLVGLAEAVLDYELNHVKIGVKLLLALVAVAFVESGAAQARRASAGPSWIVHAVGLAAIVNAAIAVLWS